MPKPKIDFLTLVTISVFSFMFATAIHEHAGHALACIAIGGHITELGAFYADCDINSVTDTGYRFVALAGPLISLVTGILSISTFNITPKRNAPLKFFLWHLATVNLMTATGYMFFSGVAGIGDLGTTESGVFHQLEPEWLIRVSLAILGLIAYYIIIRISIAKMDTFIGGEGLERVRRAQSLSLISYLSGGVIALLIGVLNPYGLFIILASAVAASMGGTSGLAWMMQLLDRKKETGDEAFTLERSWAWVALSIIFVGLYAFFFGPTIYL